MTASRMEKWTHLLKLIIRFLFEFFIALHRVKSTMFAVHHSIDFVLWFYYVFCWRMCLKSSSSVFEKKRFRSTKSNPSIHVRRATSVCRARISVFLDFSQFFEIQRFKHTFVHFTVELSTFKRPYQKKCVIPDSIVWWRSVAIITWNVLVDITCGTSATIIFDFEKATALQAIVKHLLSAKKTIRNACVAASSQSTEKNWSYQFYGCVITLVFTSRSFGASNWALITN